MTSDVAVTRRVGDVVSRLRELLDDETDDVVLHADLLEGLAGVTGDVQDVLRREGRRDAQATAVWCRDLVALTDLQRRVRERLVRHRFEAVTRVHESLLRLRAARSVSELLPAAAEELGRSCGFDRTVISRRRGSTWRAEAVWVAPEIDPAVAAAIRDYLMTQWIPLRPGTLENDLVHRRTAAVISADDPKVDRELVIATSSRRYVASPVMPSGEVIGFLQADLYGRDRELTDLDRDNMWTFAEGFGLVFEHLALRERLEAQRARVRDAFVSAEQGLATLSSDEMLLARYDEQALAEPAAAEAEAGPLRLEGLLTAREREVLDLMAAGARNAEIADRLVISEGTVKSHVRTISRKLRASNRADAVARYLRLTMREQR